MKEGEGMYNTVVVRMFSETDAKLNTFLTDNKGRFDNKSHVVRAMINHCLQCNKFKYL